MSSWPALDVCRGCWIINFLHLNVYVRLSIIEVLIRLLAFTICIADRLSFNVLKSDSDDITHLDRYNH